MKERGIAITALDRDRLKALIQGLRRAGDDVGPHLNDLSAELDRARIVPSDAVPADVVTMNSKVRLHDLDTGEEMTYRVVFPEDADPTDGRVSVLAPFGMAILGHRVGDTFEWKAPARTRRFTVRKVLYQPEAAGHFHL